MNPPIIKLSSVPVGRIFVTHRGNVCQKTGATTITRLFNQQGQASVHLDINRSPNEVISTILPIEFLS